jgi:hypothetical protein
MMIRVLIMVDLLAKNSTTVRVDIKIMFIYSAIKIKAKGVALYSTLNPETISDSPSAKSNGARFVSARQVTSQVQAIGKKKKATEKLLRIISLNSRDSFRISVDSIIRAMETS